MEMLLKNKSLEPPITLEEQLSQIKKYVAFRKRLKMKKFLVYTGYFRASRYCKFLLSKVDVIGGKPKQNDLFELYKFDVELRKILLFYCNRVEVRFKSALSNSCSIKLANSTFYLLKEVYNPSRGKKDAKTRKANAVYFTKFYNNLLREEKSIRSKLNKYPELKDYINSGNRKKNKLPIWAICNYVDFGTVIYIYKYLRGDLRKEVLNYTFLKDRHKKFDTEVVDTWLDATRNLRNYCAHNSMLVGMTSSVVLKDKKDKLDILVNNNDLFSRIYALKKLIPNEDVEKLKREISSLIKRTKIDICLLGVLPLDWEDIYDNISVF